LKNPNPTHLNCPWCPAQAFPSVCLVVGDVSTRKYVCPAQHVFFILSEDTSFNYGHNLTQEKA
jgi:hypothetical protein